MRIPDDNFCRILRFFIAFFIRKRLPQATFFIATAFFLFFVEFFGLLFGFFVRGLIRAAFDETIKPAQIKFPLAHLIAALMHSVRFSERIDVIHIFATVDFAKMSYSPVIVADELRPPDMYNRMTIMAYGNNVFKLLDMLFFVVTPPFVRFESPTRLAAYHAFSFRAVVRVMADDFPHFRLQNTS